MEQVDNVCVMFRMGVSGCNVSFMGTTLCSLGGYYFVNQ